MIRDHLPSLLLWCWSATSPFLFRVLPGRDAAIACLVAGWALLPVALYPEPAPADEAKGSAIHSVAVPTTILVNKATAIGLGGLAGLILFDRRAFDRLRLDLVDLPMVAWCLVPLASSTANGLPLSEGLAQVRYLGLAWGVPYLLGRAYLADPESQVRFAVALALGGLAYLPICLVEIVAGPSAYRLAYGFHPYEFEGASRFLGSRPLGFLEHGNQLGIWMASSAVAATWLRASGSLRRLGGIPGGVVAATLIGATLLCQSHGSILIMGLALAPLLVARLYRGRRSRRRAAVAVGLVALGLAILAGGLLVASRGLDVNSLRLEAGEFFKGIRKSSFTWRLSRSEEFLPMALRRPWLGWGRADWRAGGLPFINPVNLSTWLLALGMYGLVGLSALVATWALPLIRAARPGAWGGPAAALMAVVAVNLLDGFSNSVVILPILAAVGGLNRPTGRSPWRA